MVILDELEWRGLIAESTDRDTLADELSNGPVSFYCGFDPTAPSLHVGNLVQILTMRRLQLAGHRPIALVGGATGLIGDPKDSGERSLNDVELVNEWLTRIEAQLAALLDFAGPNPAQAVNNYDWTKSMTAIDFLRTVGKNFSVNRMLDREAVKARLEGDGISFTEFSYQLLQSYDYVVLNRDYDCRLQTGGSDQWGNITAGVNLVRRMNKQAVHALTTPLLEKADGTKFGKTEGGTIWLDPAMTSPYAFYQFWLNSDDRDVGQYLRVFSFLSKEEIDELAAATEAEPHRRTAQRALARELTTLIHGADVCAGVEAAAAALFGGGDLAEQDSSALAGALTAAGTLPGVRANLEAGIAVVDLLADWAKIGSKGAARRAIKEGGAYLNNSRVTDPETTVQTSDLIHDRWLVLRRGKKNMVGVDFS